MKIKSKFNNLIKFMLLSILSTVANLVYAKGDTTFSTWTDWIVDKLSGSGGMFIAIVGLVLTVIQGVSGNYKTAVSLFFVVILAVLGPDIVQGLFSATF